MGRVFLAAGHYPSQPGAGFEGFYEHDEAVRWVDVMEALDPDLFVVVPIGDLKSKARFINARAQPDDVAAEVHFNSAVDKVGARVGSGCVTLYMPGSAGGKLLASACQAAMAQVFQPDRGVVEGWYRGERTRGAYYFLERTSCPAIILEPEFVHRRQIIQERRDAACYALFSALRGHLEEFTE